MTTLKDISNQRFGRLIAIEPTKIKNKTVWKCKCDCNTDCFYTYHALISGNNSSCGCLVEENRHYCSDTRLYETWCNMKARCTNPKNTAYHNYGGKGISICKDWEFSFVNFKEWAMNNGYTDELTIDRINSKGNYEPSNCRWANRKTQGNNTSRNHIITYNGITKTMSEWSDELDISYTVLRRRINDGWTIKESIETPLIKSNLRNFFDKSFTFEERDIMYFNTKYGKFSCQSVSNFFGLSRGSINKYLNYGDNNKKTATELIENYLQKYNKRVEELKELDINKY